MKGSIDKTDKESQLNAQNGNQFKSNSSNIEPLKVFVNQPKLLVMGSKSYRFECDDLYSPKTSTVCDSTTAPPFPLVSTQFFDTPLSNASHHSSENFLSVPMMPILGSSYRKFSCPHINFNFSHSSHTNLKSDNNVHGDPFSGQQSMLQTTANSVDQICKPTLQQSSNFDPNESLNMVSQNLTSMLTDLNSNSNLNLGNFIGTALNTSVQSLKLSLEFYRYFMLVKTDSVDSGTCDQFSELSASDDDTAKALVKQNPTLKERIRSMKSLESDQQRLSLQNLYVEVLEVEKMLHNCLEKFKKSQYWPIFISKHINQLQKAIEKVCTNSCYHAIIQFF